MSEHIGRNWVAPDPFAPSCGCPLLGCGLVDQAAANERGCDQHSVAAVRTIRTSHSAQDCIVKDFTLFDLKPQDLGTGGSE